MQTEIAAPIRCRRPITTTQPLEALQQPGALLKIDTVLAITGLSTATLYRRIADGTFPRPLKIGRVMSRWSADDVRHWASNLRPEVSA